MTKQEQKLVLEELEADKAYIQAKFFVETTDLKKDYEAKRHTLADRAEYELEKIQQRIDELKEKN